MAESYKLVGVREFRQNIATYREPVTVVHTRGEVKVLGTWYPALGQPGSKSPNMGVSKMGDG